MGNTTKGNLYNIYASILSIATIFFWFGKAFKVTATPISNSSTKIKSTINMYDLLKDGPFASLSSFLLCAVVVLAIIVLYKSINGILKNENNCLLSTTLLSSAFILFIYMLVLKKSYVLYDNEYYIVKTTMSTNLIFMLGFLLFSFITSIIGTISSFSPNGEFKTGIKNSLSRVEGLLKKRNKF